MMKCFVRILLLGITAGGCAAGGGSVNESAPQPVPVEEPTNPALWRGDRRLYNILNVAPLGAAQQDSLAAYGRELPNDIDANLGRAARDTNAPTYVRLNALSVLGTRQSRLQLPAFREAIDDDDPRIRATAVASLRGLMNVVPDETVRIVRLALRDDNAEVQAQALQILADREPELLRHYLPVAANAELRKIAQDLISLSEERGAGVIPDAAGILRRTSSHGYTVTFTPVQQWPKWRSAVGSVRVEGAGIAAFTLMGMEAVAGVMPVFFSVDGVHAVYERERAIYVRNLKSGTERLVASGVAPRALPFSESFVYMREVPGSIVAVREKTRIRYEVMRVPFAEAAEPTLLGATGVMTTYDAFGNYSPVRWMRVEERAGNYFLIADGLEMFALPNPFG